MGSFVCLDWIGAKEIGELGLLVEYNVVQWLYRAAVTIEKVETLIVPSSIIDISERVYIVQLFPLIYDRSLYRSTSHPVTTL